MRLIPNLKSNINLWIFKLTKKFKPLHQKRSMNIILGTLIGKNFRKEKDDEVLQKIVEMHMQIIIKDSFLLK